LEKARNNEIVEFPAVHFPSNLVPEPLSVGLADVSIDKNKQIDNQ